MKKDFQLANTSANRSQISNNKRRGRNTHSGKGANAKAVLFEGLMVFPENKHTKKRKKYQKNGQNWSFENPLVSVEPASYQVFFDERELANRHTICLIFET